MSKTMADIEVMEVTAPAVWATALVNGDFSGLEDDAECERVQAFVDSLPGPVVDMPEELGFRHSGFGTDTPDELGGDYCLYSVLVMD